MVAVLHPHSAAAGRAAQQAREQVFRPALFVGAISTREFLHMPDALEKGVVDDAQVFRVGAVPISLDVRSTDPPARVRVLQHADPVPDQHAVVQRVGQNTVPALAVAVDRDGGPPVAPRRRHALAVQLSRDVARAAACDVGGVDAPDHGGFLLDDLHLAGLPGNGPVAVGPAAGVAPVADDAGHAAARLVGEVLEIQRTDQPADADLDLIGDAVVYGADLDADEAQALVDAGEVFLVAADAITLGMARKRPSWWSHGTICACLRAIGRPDRTEETAEVRRLGVTMNRSIIEPRASEKGR